MRGEILSWLFYSFMFACLSILLCSGYVEAVCLGLILGFFAGILNSINNKLDKNGKKKF